MEWAELPRHGSAGPRPGQMTYNKERETIEKLLEYGDGKMNDFLLSIQDFLETRGFLTTGQIEALERIAENFELQNDVKLSDIDTQDFF